MYYLFIAYLLFHNKHIFLLYLYVAIVCFYCFDFNFEFSNIVFFEFFKVNEKLINGWFMIHPFLTYFFYAIFLVIIYIIHIYYKLAIFKDIFMLLFYKYIFSYIMRVIVYICILIGCVALILGGWWAQQEIS